MKNGYYWLTSERASKRSVCQYINDEWFLINEVGPVTLDEIIQRGWVLGKYIKKQDDI